jgi:hypothetical protein
VSPVFGQQIKNAGPDDLAISRGGFNGLSPLRQSTGVMEWWSNGVMKGIIQVEIRAFAFSSTPILQYSNTPKQLAIFTGKAIQR